MSSYDWGDDYQIRGTEKGSRGGEREAARLHHFERFGQALLHISDWWLIAHTGPDSVKRLSLTMELIDDHQQRFRRCLHTV
jgi:hypothetical protein